MLSVNVEQRVNVKFREKLGKSATETYDLLKKVYGITKVPCNVIQILVHRNISCTETRGRGQLKCDGTHTETRFRLSEEKASPFKPAGASGQSTTDCQGARASV
jgi:hypothetical protein